MEFTCDWIEFESPDGSIVVRPMLWLDLLQNGRRQIRERFLIDSGADYSMLPQRFCKLLGIRWNEGTPKELSGISPREECNVRGYIHPLAVCFREIQLRLTIPCCFVEGESPLLLGRAGVFEAFDIEFDSRRRRTVFRRR